MVHTFEEKLSIDESIFPSRTVKVNSVRSLTALKPKYKFLEYNVLLMYSSLKQELILMNGKPKVFEWLGYTVALVTFFFSIVVFYHYSDDLYYSWLAAFLSAMLVWLSYIIIRMLVMAMR